MLNGETKILDRLRKRKIPLSDLSRLAKNITISLNVSKDVRSFLFFQAMWEYKLRSLRNHPYIMSAHFLPFWTLPTHLISTNTVLNVSKTGHFLDTPTQSFSWRNIGMVPNTLKTQEVRHEIYPGNTFRLAE